MTARPPPAPLQAPPGRWSAGRIVALVLGVVLLLPGLGLLAGGGALLYADSSHRPDGYLTSDPETFETAGFALTSDRVSLSTGADWVPVSSALGTARFQVTADPGTDVFIGIAPAADVAGYLDGVRRTVVDDLGSTFGTTGISQLDGSAPAGPPGDQTFWTAQASGSGAQALTWKPTSGNWVLVVMNADASAGVRVTGTVGATVPSLVGLAWGLLIAGALITAIGVLLIVLAVRRGARRSGPPTVYQPAPPSNWAPPTPRSPTEETQEAPAPASGR